MKIILVSHGQLALGMKNTLEMIAGFKDDIMAYAAYDENAGNEFISEIETVVKNSEEETVIIISDVFGGSVNNEMMQLLRSYKNIYLITGMNFPLVVTLAMMNKNKVSKKDVVSAIRAGQEGVVLVNDLIV